MNHDPLTDRDYQRLGATLARFSEQQCMSLEQLDGFFTGLLCGPMPLKPADCLPMILGDAFDDEQAFPTEQSLDRFAKLLLRHWFDISDTLRDGTAFHPWLDEDESGVVHGNQWAQGFCDAMQLMPEDWALLFEDEQAAVHLEPIMALAFEQEADDAPVSGHRRQRTTPGLAGRDHDLGTGDSCIFCRYPSGAVTRRSRLEFLARLHHRNHKASHAFP